MRQIITVFFVFLFNQVFCQNQYFTNYKNIVPQGKIPKIITQSFEEKVEIAVKNEISKEEIAKTKKRKRAFLLSSTFSISDFLQSGNVLFNDTLTQYVTSVSKILLKDDPELFQQLNFFVVKSPYVNAFTTNDGLVFVNMGLLAHLETEAQLAYVLAHEIIHYKNKHVIKIYVEHSTIQDYYKKKQYSADDALLKQTSFSKEMEMEADREGLALYLKSDYGLKNLNGVFDLLQKAHLPIAQVPFDSSFFNDSYLKVPGSYFLKEVNKIEIHDEESSTHPNISTRREKILDLLKDQNTLGDKDFIRSKEEFFFIRNVARFELSDLFLRKRMYSEAIYNSYVLEKEFPNNSYLKENIATALYFRAKYCNRPRYNLDTTSIDVEGESHQVYHVLRKFSQEELNVIASQYIWKTYFQYPERAILKRRAEEILNEMMHVYYAEKDTFFREHKGALPLIIGPSVDVKYAFVDLFKQPEFITSYDKTLQKMVERPHKRAMVYGFVSFDSDNRRIDSYGVDKLIVIDPLYIKMSTNFMYKFRFFYQKSLQKEKMLNDEIPFIAEKTNLKTELISPHNFDSLSVNKYIELYRLNEYLGEIQNNHHVLDSFISVDYALPEYLMEKYQTTHFAWNFMMRYTFQKDRSLLPWFLFPALWPYAPFYSAFVLVPRNFVFHNIIMADASTNKIEIQNFYRMKGINLDAKIRSNLYYNFMQIKKKQKPTDKLQTKHL